MDYSIPSTKSSKFVAKLMITIGIICGASLIVFLILSLLVQMSPYRFTLYESPNPLAIFMMILLLPSIYLISPAIIGDNSSGSFLYLLPYLVVPIIFIFFGFMLLKRKKWAWCGAVIFLTFEIWLVTYQLALAGANIFSFSNPSLYVSLPLLMLLLLDRKNYLKKS